MPALKRTTVPSARTTRLRAADLMRRDVVCVRAELSLDALTLLFLESGLRAVPVVDERGRVLGMVSDDDVQLEIHARPAPAGVRKVADVMRPLLLTLSEHTPVTQAAGFMVTHELERVPVVADDGTVVGVLSSADILHWVAVSDPALRMPSSAG